MTSRRTTAALSTACISALLLSSCGLLDDEAPEDQDPHPADSAADDQHAEAGADGPEGDDADGDADEDTDRPAGAREIVQAQDGSRAVPPEEALASIEYELGGDDSVIVSVATLEETDEFLLMELYYWPQLEDEGDSMSIHDMLGDQASNSPGPLPRIYDRENLKVYRAFHHNSTTAHIGMPTASDGEAIYWWGFYPLIEDDVDSLDIRFARERPHLQDVSFQGGAGTDEEPEEG
ncbi:hypothetical protein [Nesterenkonia suensis]